MASIDRYRPPREGYQPPVAKKRPSRSPGRRPDIPPAAPTPPQHSARTSPPKPNERPQSPAQSDKQAPLAPANQWAFSVDEISSTPTILDGIPPSEERLRRAKGVNFIYQAGVMLDLPQITLWVAGVYFHRFYMRCSMAQEKNQGGIHHYNIAATALFLANKVEENCRKTKDIIIAVAKVAQKNAHLIIDEQSKEYWRWRDSILTYEELMLEQLTFDLMVENPYRYLFELLGQLDIVHNKNLRQAAWAFCNDACLTTLPLLVEPRDVAIAAIFFASIHTNQPIDDINGEPWWKYLNGVEDHCCKAIELIRQFYTENPLRKQNPALPSPAFDLESSRRRNDVIDNLSSNAATPMDVDRGSRSPAAKMMNGGGDKDTDMRDRAPEGSQGSLKPEDSRSSYAPRSPAKRKSPEPGPRVEVDRAEKRAKTSGSEDEEGELVE